MENKVNEKKRWYKYMWIYIVSFILLCILLFLAIQGIRCANFVKKAKEDLKQYNAIKVELSYGDMYYVDKGEGEVILSVQGIFGGYDQAYNTCAGFSDKYRILAPARFGYLGSDMKDNSTPKEQAKAYVELLDILGIDKVYILATSAGGSIAIQFALNYPERTKGLILYCSSVPQSTKPEKYSQYAGPPGAICNDYTMFLLSPFFKPIMGMAPSTIYSMLPCKDRKGGIVNDASVTNPDMNRNYDEYKIESIQVPTIIFHAKDDKVAPYDAEGVKRFPNCTCIIFENGGHLMEGHGDEINIALSEFMNNK